MADTTTVELSRMQVTVTEAEKPPAELSDADIQKRLDCYGASFCKAEEICQACPVAARCVTRIAKVLVPQLARERGHPVGDFTRDTLAEALESDVDSAAIVQQVMKGKSAAALLPVLPPDPLPPPKDDTDDDDSILDSLGTSPPPPPVPPVVAAPAPAPQAIAAAVPPVKVKKKKKPPVVVAEKAEVAHTPPPPTKEKKAVKTKKEQPKKKAPASADVPDAAGAYDRERAKSTFVAALKHGQVLARDFKGTSYQLRVDAHEKRYLLSRATAAPKAFATVYAAIVSIVGTKDYPRQKVGKKKSTGARALSAWSAKRFWAAASGKAPVAKKAAKPSKKKEKSPAKKKRKR